MLEPLPYPTINEYHRAFQAGTLVDFFFRKCPDCGGRVYLSLRHRIFLNIDYYMGRCAGKCRKRYSFLPPFVAFRKWYSSIDISEARKFIEQPKFSSVSAALQEWEIERENRICEGLTAGPCRTTVYNWHKEQQKESVSLAGSDDSGTSHVTDKVTASQAAQLGNLSSMACSRLPSINESSRADSAPGEILCQLRISSILILVFSFLFSGHKTSCIVYLNEFNWSLPFWAEDMRALVHFEAENLINRRCPEAEYTPLTDSGYCAFAGIPP